MSAVPLTKSPLQLLSVVIPAQNEKDLAIVKEEPRVMR